jgi:hypothetical protein
MNQPDGAGIASQGAAQDRAANARKKPPRQALSVLQDESGPMSLVHRVFHCFHGNTYRVFHPVWQFEYNLDMKPQRRFAAGKGGFSVRIIQEENRHDKTSDQT